MTIIYQYKIATASMFGFPKLLACWKGSVYKLMFKETLIFGIIYTVISVIYRYAPLNAAQKRLFERVVLYCNHYTNLIPVSFVLGFYVSIVVNRWWQQFSNVPWPDRTLFLMGTYLQGQDEQSRITRRTVARYMMFGFILILRSISVAVMKRYPTIDHIVAAGFITSEEAVVYDSVVCKYNTFWVPLVWANQVLTEARREGRIDSETGFRLVMEQLADFRDKCSLCFVYDWITIPLVYTQVVTLAVYMFFGACLLGRQFVEGNEDHPDFYIPFFTILQFFFYMGWLKVAEQLINPFGEDDDDFDMNWLIDRHTAVAMCLVDHCHGYTPPLTKDARFNGIVEDLPYTEGSMASRRPNFLGSTYKLVRPSMQEQKVISPSNLLGVPQVNGPRHRSQTTTGHLGGSMRSLFGMKPNLRKAQMDDSRVTIKSLSNVASGYGPAGYHASISYSPMPQRGYEHHLEATPNLINSDDLPPENVALRRARASTVADLKPLQRVCDTDRERKWRFPLSLLRWKQNKDISEKISMNSDNLSLSSLESRVGGDSQQLLSTEVSKQQQQPVPSRPNMSRFTVESVEGDTEVDTSKHSRNKQIIDKHIDHMSVTGPPVLSAIEEGSTIRSLNDIVPSTSCTSQWHMDKPQDTVIECIPTTTEEEFVDSVFEDVFEDDLDTISVEKARAGLEFHIQPVKEPDEPAALQKTSSLESLNISVQEIIVEELSGNYVDETRSKPIQPTQETPADKPFRVRRRSSIEAPNSGIPGIVVKDFRTDTVGGPRVSIDEQAPNTQEKAPDGQDFFRRKLQVIMPAFVIPDIVIDEIR